MKDMMLAMMSAMMPYMFYVVYLGAAAAVIGLVFLVINLLNGSMGDLLKLAGNVLIGVGVFFLACELAGAWLGAAPSINFGNEDNFEFILVRFWKLGVAALVVGVIYNLLAKRSQTAVEA